MHRASKTCSTIPPSCSDVEMAQHDSDASSTTLSRLQSSQPTAASPLPNTPGELFTATSEVAELPTHLARQLVPQYNERQTNISDKFSAAITSTSKTIDYTQTETTWTRVPWSQRTTGTRLPQRLPIQNNSLRGKINYYNNHPQNNQRPYNNNRNNNGSTNSNSNNPANNNVMLVSAMSIGTKDIRGHKPF
ncbi:hypothetical protein BX661DRAFT_168898 [Kickxella alabastrina]|uniref:uncharacterized protein n=1 Tax=Kickxella alabastrina TaxID=61397 RepID=UPI00222002E6|nr:uncharacterized protein BX661DRAFT_168898 [Kickxella alabastrina]KAI7833771.1 hypothetical protein BX661DRAFT_168898 [Kickxella alabastrina]